MLNTGSGSEIQFLSEAQDDPQKRKPDIKKAKLLLGWEPVVCTTKITANLGGYFQNVTALATE